jgi:uncharacterized membrane protein
MHRISAYFLEITISTFFYIGFFYFNAFIDQQFEVTKSVSWLFLPAGLRVFLSLVFIYSGALGLFLGSLLINFVSFPDFDIVTKIGIATICGTAPLMSRLFVIHHFEVEPNLQNLSIRQLITIIVIFALFSSGLHQLWFITRGSDSGSWNLFITMFFGDIIGSIVFLVLIKFIIGYLRKILKKFSTDSALKNTIEIQFK